MSDEEVIAMFERKLGDIPYWREQWYLRHEKSPTGEDEIKREYAACIRAFLGIEEQVSA